MALALALRRARHFFEVRPEQTGEGELVVRQACLRGATPYCVAIFSRNPPRGKEASEARRTTVCRRWRTYRSSSLHTRSNEASHRLFFARGKMTDAGHRSCFQLCDNKRLVGQSLSALCTSSLQNVSAVGSLHSLSETMLFLSLTLFGLVSSEHNCTSLILVIGSVTAKRHNSRFLQ